jgi:uncharacterized phage protein (TIGR01671 family)
MRDIKFRYWDKITKKLYEVGQIDWDKKTISPKNYIGYTQSFISFEQTELMEYTGLKDKNGVEIYEGDIVKSLINIFVVVYEKGSFCVKGINRNQKYTIYQELMMSDKAKLSLEIIGNNYENPELLESVK